VVVEEGPALKTKKEPTKLAQSIVATTQTKKSPATVEEAVEDDDEDEVSDDEEDEFDIDDSSPEAVLVPAVGNRQTPEEEALGMAKAREQAGADPLATPAPHDGNNYMYPPKPKPKSKSRSRERTRFRSNSHSGVDTPSRFAGPTPHPPHVSTRHIESADFKPLCTGHPEQQGTRDDINMQRSGHSSGKSRIPQDRDIDAESLNLKTPTVANAMDGGKRGLHRGHSPEHERHHHHRAFAVWGQDESDSNASDSDA
jgi:NAD+ kinase